MCGTDSGAMTLQRIDSRSTLTPEPLPNCQPRSVFSLQAKSVLVNGIDGLAATGRWVDFGLRSVSVGLNIPEDGGEEEGGATGQAPELEIVDFPYGGWADGLVGWWGSRGWWG